MIPQTITTAPIVAMKLVEMHMLRGTTRGRERYQYNARWGQLHGQSLDRQRTHMHRYDPISAQLWWPWLEPSSHTLAS